MNKKMIVLFMLVIGFATLNSFGTMYANDMDYVIGDAKQGFIKNMVNTEAKADNLLIGFKKMGVNGIRVPIFPAGEERNIPIFNYFYEQAVAQGFLIFGNPAQGAGGHRIASGSLSDKVPVKDDPVATQLLIDTIQAFANNYPCKWINAFNEDAKSGGIWSVAQMNQIYSTLENNLNGAEQVGPCVWGIPASIQVFNTTKVDDYITVATTHNLGFNHGSWPTFIALAKAKNLPVWDSEVTHSDKYGNGTRLESAIKNNVDGLVLYNSWSSVNLSSGALNGMLGQMDLYMNGGRPQSLPYAEGFEDGIGAWQQSYADDFNWSVGSGYTDSATTGPSEASEGLQYLFAEGNNGGQYGTTAVTCAFDLSTDADMALTFDYHMAGGAIGTLAIDVFDGTAWTTNVWSRTGAQQAAEEDAWLQALVDLSPFVGNPHVAVKFRYEKDQWALGDPAIDNIRVEDQPESIPYAESFEDGIGAWKQVTNDGFDWSIGSGYTDSNTTGPSEASEGAQYLFAEGHDGGQYAVTSIDCRFDFTTVSSAELSFDYHMTGGNTGTLALDVFDGSEWTLSFWELSGQHQTSEEDPWKQAVVDLSSFLGSREITLRFRYTKAQWAYGDTAIDNISLTGDPNTMPVADGRTESLDEDDSLAMVLTGSDAEGASLTFDITTEPAHGRLDGDAPNVTYIPNDDYNGTDSFTFTVNDGTIDSVRGKVSLTIDAVDDVPVFSTEKITETVLQGFYYNSPVLGSVSNPDEDELTYSADGVPAWLTVAEDGTVSGQAHVADIGTHSFTIQLEDPASRSDTTVFEITVVASTVSPVNLGVGFDIASAEAAAFRSTGISKTYDSDGDDAYGSAGTFFFGNGVDKTSNSDSTPSWVTSVGSTGTTLAASAAYTEFDNPTLAIADAVANWTTTAIGYVNEETADLWLELMTFTVDATAPRTFRLGIMAGNENTSDGRWNAAGLRVSFEGGPAAVVSDLAAASLGMVFFNVTLPDNAAGTFSVEGQTRNNDGNTKGPSIAGITFDTMINVAPVAHGASVGVVVDRTTPITLSGSDANGDHLTYQVVSQPIHGELNGEAPNLTYTPATGYVGADSFTFMVNDGELDSAPATVSITVSPTVVVFEATPSNTTAIYNNGVGTIAGSAGALTYTSPLVNFNNGGFTSTETINSLYGSPLTVDNKVTIKLSVSGITGTLRANGLLFGLSDYTEWDTSTTHSMLVQMDAENSNSDIQIHANSFQDAGDTGGSASDAELYNGFDMTLVADVDGYTFTLDSVGNTSPLTYSGTFAGNEFVERFGEGHFIYMAQRYNSGTVPLVSTITEASITVARGEQVENHYDLWAVSAFAAAPEGTDQEADGNPDGDRFNNAMEWALVTDPLVDDEPSLGVSISNENFVATYVRRKASETGVDVYSSWATSLTSTVWKIDGDGMTETSQGLSNKVETVLVELPLSHTNAFIRIQAVER